MKILKKLANSINGPEYKSDNKDLLNYSFDTNLIVYVYNTLYIGANYNELNMD